MNYHLRPAGFRRLVRALSDVELFWLELDAPNAGPLADARSSSPYPIASGEALVPHEAFVPYLNQRAMDVVIIDALWNGAVQATKIAAMADARGLHVATHNYYGHLGTFMNAHWAAAVPNLRLMETDI